MRSLTFGVECECTLMGETSHAADFSVGCDRSAGRDAAGTHRGDKSLLQDALHRAAAAALPEMHLSLRTSFDPVLVVPAVARRDLINELDCKDSCRHIAVVKKLGCRLHVDYCLEPAMLDALLHALQCDPCWEVRRAAAWSLFQQNARTEPSVLALYISSRLDPHYQVRVRAAEALDLLTLGKVECYTELYKAADQLMRVLQAKGYRAGRDCCLITSATACAPGGGLSISTTLPKTPDKATPRHGEGSGRETAARQMKTRRGRSDSSILHAIFRINALSPARGAIIPIVRSIPFNPSA